ncbi:MAG: hypothetical protein HYX68_14555 [Planctomycetes bacterium]|nr:hypothetical protein [Planctomycetota bacterium]
MSLCLSNRFLTCLGVSAFLWLVSPVVGLAQTFGTPCGVDGGCAAACFRSHCPPAFHITVPHPPRLCWRHGCARPVCNPCDLPHFGYFETCWSPWPFPQDFSHCYLTPPAALVNLDPLVHPNAPQMRPQMLPKQSNPGIRPQPTPPGTLIPPPDGDIFELPPPRKNTEKRPGLND